MSSSRLKLPKKCLFHTIFLSVFGAMFFGPYGFNTALWHLWQPNNNIYAPIYPQNSVESIKAMGTIGSSSYVHFNGHIWPICYACCIPCLYLCWGQCSFGPMVLILFCDTYDTPITIYMQQYTHQTLFNGSKQWAQEEQGHMSISMGRMANILWLFQPMFICMWGTMMFWPQGVDFFFCETYDTPITIYMH